MIIFKSCYPVTKIISDTQLNTYKKEYWKIAKVIGNYPDKLFIALTPPPLRSELTHPHYARRARLFSQWLLSKEFVGKRKNLVVFDLFNLLAEENSPNAKANTLKENYCRRLSFDSHPNTRANQEIAPLFVDALIAEIQHFFSVS